MNERIARLAAMTSICFCLDASAPLHAQEESPVSAATAPTPAATAARAADDIPLGGWILAGLDATLGTRGRLTASGGYVGGFDSWITLAEGSVAAGAALQLVAGHVLLHPADGDAATTSVLRGGLNWSPLRGRVAVDNRLLAERRWTRGQASPRVRDRLRLSWAVTHHSPVRLFAALEAFAVDRRGLSERRYQAGLTAPVGRVSVEAYWLRSTARTRPPFNTIGLTLLWRQSWRPPSSPRSAAARPSPALSASARSADDAGAERFGDGC